MEIHYDSNKLKKQLTDPVGLIKSYGSMAQKIKLRLHQMENSPTLATLLSIPGAKCHPLKGDMTGEWAVEVSGNYRMLFRLDHKPIPKNENNSINTDLITKIEILGIEDYH